MFSTIDEIFHNHTISFQQTVTILSLSNYHSPGADPHQPHSNTPKILLTFQKNFISSYQILRETSFTDLQTYQSTSNITPRLPIYTSQRTLKYTTLLHYSNIPNTKVKKPSHARSTWHDAFSVTVFTEYVLTVGQSVEKISVFKQKGYLWTRAQSNSLKYVWGLLISRGAHPIMAYMGRLSPKGVFFSDFRYMKG